VVVPDNVRFEGRDRYQVIPKRSRHHLHPEVRPMSTSIPSLVRRSGVASPEAGPLLRPARRPARLTAASSCTSATCTPCCACPAVSSMHRAPRPT
jgi:hypothetical protein